MKVRNLRSCITVEDCKSFKKSAIAAQLTNTPVCRDLSVQEVCRRGDEKMAKDNFVLIKDRYDV